MQPCQFSCAQARHVDSSICVCSIFCKMYQRIKQSINIKMSQYFARASMMSKMQTRSIPSSLQHYKIAYISKIFIFDTVYRIRMIFQTFHLGFIRFRLEIQSWIIVLLILHNIKLLFCAFWTQNDKDLCLYKTCPTHEENE